jgi:RNA polymerase sigma-70 factor, ECF subfamily
VVDAATVGRIFREESGRSVAALIRFCGDIDLAEDAVQEAFTIALGKWPEEGLPPNPGGWITTTAPNAPSTGCAATPGAGISSVGRH